MNKLVFSTLLMIGMNLSAHASVPGAYPAGPANLLPAAASTNTIVWVGGDVAKALFEGMTKAERKVEGFTEARLGENMGCVFNSFSQYVTYSCALTLESATGKAVVRQ